jgi:hypothetical protein
MDNEISRGCAVSTRGSMVIGIVTTVDRSRGLAWVIWPDRCGLSECQPMDYLQAVCDRETITHAIQVIAPVQQLSNPLERAFLSGSLGSSSTQIVEYDDNGSRRRPYYDPKAARP